MAHALWLEAARVAVLRWEPLRVLIGNQAGGEESQEKGHWMAEATAAWFLEVPDGAVPALFLAVVMGGRGAC
jgi:hypothetical protein